MAASDALPEAAAIVADGAASRAQFREALAKADAPAQPSKEASQLPIEVQFAAAEKLLKTPEQAKPETPAPKEVASTGLPEAKAIVEDGAASRAQFREALAKADAPAQPSKEASQLPIEDQFAAAAAALKAQPEAPAPTQSKGVASTALPEAPAIVDEAQAGRKKFEEHLAASIPDKPIASIDPKILQMAKEHGAKATGGQKLAAVAVESMPTAALSVPDKSTPSRGAAAAV